MQIVIVLIGISFITFALTFMSPGDPVRNMYTATGVMPTEEMVQETRQELGLNDPFLTQYTRWLGNCLKGDFGKSYSLNKPVTELLAGRLWPTLKLTLMSMILMVIISVWHALGGLQGQMDRLSHQGNHISGLCDAELLGWTSSDACILRLYPRISGYQLCGRFQEPFSSGSYAGDCHVLKVYETGQDCGAR